MFVVLCLEALAEIMTARSERKADKDRRKKHSIRRQRKRNLPRELRKVAKATREVLHAGPTATGSECQVLTPGPPAYVGPDAGLGNFGRRVRKVRKRLYRGLCRGLGCGATGKVEIFSERRKKEGGKAWFFNENVLHLRPIIPYRVQTKRAHLMQVGCMREGATRRS